MGSLPAGGEELEAGAGTFRQVSRGTIIVDKNKRETTILRIIFFVGGDFLGLFQLVGRNWKQPGEYFDRYPGGL